MHLKFPRKFEGTRTKLTPAHGLSILVPAVNKVQVVRIRPNFAYDLYLTLEHYTKNLSLKSQKVPEISSIFVWSLPETWYYGIIRAMKLLWSLQYTKELTE